jgi:hypothetical protein
MDKLPDEYFGVLPSRPWPRHDNSSVNPTEKPKPQQATQKQIVAAKIKKIL